MAKTNRKRPKSSRTKKSTKRRKSTARRKQSTILRRVTKEIKRVNDLFFRQIGCGVIVLVIIGAITLTGVLILTREMNERREYEIAQQEILEQRQSFIDQLAVTAQRLEEEYGIKASVSLAQAALESNFGTSQLGAVYHNLYGVKTSEDDPDGVDLPTLEFIDGQYVEIIDRFKVYPSWEASMESHAKLIQQGTTWDPEYYKAVTDGSTYQEQAQGLQDSGYATDPTYAEKIINMIEEWELHYYDK